MYETTKVLWPHRPHEHKCEGGTVEMGVPVRVSYYRDATGDRVNDLLGVFQGVSTYFGDWYARFNTTDGIKEIKLHYIQSLRFYLEQPKEEV